MPTLNETFIDELKDIYDAEHQLTKALPKMAKAAEHEDLKAGFEEHLEQTKEHIKRLERVFEIFEELPKRKTCKAMKGLVEEASEMIEEKAGDAAYICGAQKVEHYEIATYGSLVAWAKLLGKDDAAEILEETLQEEKDTDEKLTDLAESAINIDAENEDENVNKKEAKPAAKKKTAKK